MAFGSFNHHRQPEAMADINVTPMVDVMLVLLVIFILSAPMFTHAIKLDLPRAQAASTQHQAATVTLAIDAKGKVFWNSVPVDPAGLESRLTEAARQAPQPELQLRADKNTRYEVVAQVMAAAQSHGLTKLGFVTDPRKEQ
jgi:biopolymer transport protein ExbD